MYEPLIRIPCIWKLPAGEQAGTRRNDMASLLDLGPSACSLSGVSLGGHPAGKDIFSDPPSEHYYAESDDEYMLRTERYKLLYMENADQRQLIDLANDPMELQNRYNDPAFAEVRRELETRLLNTVLFEYPPAVHFDFDAPGIRASSTSPAADPDASIEYSRRKMQEQGM